MHALPHSVLPALQQATADPCLCRRLQDTHGHVLVSLLWGHCSFIQGPGAHKVLFAPSKSLFPQSSVSSVSGSLAQFMAISSKRTNAIPRTAAPRAPAPVEVHYWPVLLKETLKHSLSQCLWGSLGPGGHSVYLSPLSVFGGYGALFWTWFCPSYCFAGASPLPLDVGCLFKITPAQHSRHSCISQPALPCYPLMPFVNHVCFLVFDSISLL